MLSTRRAGLTWLSHEAWPSSFLAQAPVSGAVKFHFWEEPVTAALPLLPQDRRARSCSYNQRRPFCVHLRGAWLWSKTPGAVCSSHVLTTRLVPALPPSHLGRVQPGRPLALADPGGGKRPPGRKPPLRRRAHLRSHKFAPATRPYPWDIRKFQATGSGNASQRRDLPARKLAAERGTRKYSPRSRLARQ